MDFEDKNHASLTFEKLCTAMRAGAIWKGGIGKVDFEDKNHTAPTFEMLRTAMRADAICC